MRLPLMPLAQLRRAYADAITARDTAMVDAQFAESEGNTAAAKVALEAAIACEERADAIKAQIERTPLPLVSVGELTGRAPAARRFETRAERHAEEVRRHQERMARRRPA